METKKLSEELRAAAAKMKSPEIKAIMLEAASQLMGHSASREAMELRLENHYLVTERDALREFIRILPCGSDALSEAGKTCDQCGFYLGCGDWSLCCDLKHDLCYDDTPACSSFLPKIEKKKESITHAQLLR